MKNSVWITVSAGLITAMASAAAAQEAKSDLPVPSTKTKFLITVGEDGTGLMKTQNGAEITLPKEFIEQIRIIENSNETTFRGSEPCRFKDRTVRK